MDSLYHSNKGRCDNWYGVKSRTGDTLEMVVCQECKDKKEPSVIF